MEMPEGIALWDSKFYLVVPQNLLYLPIDCHVDIVKELILILHMDKRIQPRGCQPRAWC